MLTIVDDELDMPQSNGLVIGKQMGVSIALLIVLLGAAVGGAVSFTVLRSDVSYLKENVAKLTESVKALQDSQNNTLSTHTAQIVILQERLRMTEEKQKEIEIRLSKNENR